MSPLKWLLAIFFISLPQASFGAETGESPSKPSSKQPTKQSSKPKEAAPTTANEKNVEEEGNEESIEPISKTDPSASVTSDPLTKRLMMGTSLKWQLVTPKDGKWNGLGGTDVLVRWKLQKDPSANWYLNSRYIPLAGHWSIHNRSYDTAIHGAFFGPEYQYPVGSLFLKGSLELGYWLVYATPQDGAEADTSIKRGQLGISTSIGLDWSSNSDKLRLGPVLRYDAGYYSVASFGVFVGFQL